jgi:hypothetical protein
MNLIILALYHLQVQDIVSSSKVNQETKPVLEIMNKSYLVVIVVIVTLMIVVFYISKFYS